MEDMAITWENISDIALFGGFSWHTESIGWEYLKLPW